MNLFSDITTGIVIIIVAVVVGSMIAYSFLKKKKDYNTNGIPEYVEDPDRTGGSSDVTKSQG